MFTWICPKCGREVPPAYNDCPDCAPQGVAKPAQQSETTPAAVPPVSVQAPPPLAPSPQAVAQQPTAAPAQSYLPPPPARGGLPTWLLTIIFAFAFFGLVAGVYWIVGAARGAGSKPTAAVESPAAKPNAKTSPYQKYIEISGVRFVPDPKKKITDTRFVITNHSSADLLGLGGNVTVWGRTRNSEEDAAGTFTFTTDLKAFESRDLTAPLNTKLKIYELPDWQNVSTDVQITAPAAGAAQ